MKAAVSSNRKRELFSHFAALARALGHEHRLELLEHLGQGEQPVEKLAELTGLGFANVSQHLQLLRRNGLVEARRAGKQVLNAANSLPSATTKVKNGCTAAAGSLTLNVPNSRGWFIGATLSGTGIAVGATVVGISPDGLTVTMSAVTTAAVSGAVTARI